LFTASNRYPHAFKIPFKKVLFEGVDLNQALDSIYTDEVDIFKDVDSQVFCTASVSWSGNGYNNNKIQIPPRIEASRSNNFEEDIHHDNNDNIDSTMMICTSKRSREKFSLDDSIKIFEQSLPVGTSSLLPSLHRSKIKKNEIKEIKTKKQTKKAKNKGKKKKDLDTSSEESESEFDEEDDEISNPSIPIDSNHDVRFMRPRQKDCDTDVDERHQGEYVRKRTDFYVVNYGNSALYVHRKFIIQPKNFKKSDELLLVNQIKAAIPDVDFSKTEFHILNVVYSANDETKTKMFEFMSLDKAHYDGSFFYNCKEFMRQKPKQNRQFVIQNMRSKGSTDTIMTGEELLYRIVRKQFNDNKYYYGRIVSVDQKIVKKYSNSKENVYDVLYEDNDKYFDVQEKDLVNLVIS
jgi:hypothetical protein